jgi:hypothetical protein
MRSLSFLAHVLQDGTGSGNACFLKIQEVLETEPVIVIRPITAYEPMPE